MYVALIITLVLIIIVFLAILKPSRLDKARKLADNVIITRKATSEEIQKIITDIVMLGALDVFSEHSIEMDKNLYESFKTKQTFDKTCNSFFNLIARKTKTKDKDRTIRKFKKGTR